MPSKPTNHKRNRNVLIGAAAVGLLLLLYFRSRSAAAAGNATSPTDVQTAATQAAQQQAAQDAQLYGTSTPSTFADNGANAAALGDSVTGGLQGINDALIQQSGAFSTLASTLAPNAAGAPVAITVNGTGQPAGGLGSTVAVSQPGTRAPVGSSAGPHGAIVAAYGAKPPPPKKNYTVVGTGSGGWIYKPKPGTPAYHK